jgi:hypothetical protein
LVCGLPSPSLLRKLSKLRKPPSFWHTQTFFIAWLMLTSSSMFSK